jgi:hypothetical protein
MVNLTEMSRFSIWTREKLRELNKGYSQKKAIGDLPEPLVAGWRSKKCPPTF